jgi:predicted nucleic acid-binding protein
LASREVFVDASAWIALSDVGDKYHHAAKGALQQLVDDGRIFVTTNLVIAEAYIVVRRTGGHAQAMRLLGSLRGSPRLAKVHSDAGLESVAEDILEKYVDQGFSLADAVSFAVMRERGIAQAFTFDRHFVTMGFEQLPAQASR